MLILVVILTIVAFSLPATLGLTSSDLSLFIIIIILATAFCLVKQNRDLSDRLTALETHHADVLAQVETQQALAVLNTNLQTSTDQLQRQNEMLRAENRTIIADRDRLRYLNAINLDTTQERDRLRGDLNALRTTNMRVIVERDRERSSNERLQADNDTLQTSNNALIVERDELRTLNERLRDNNAGQIRNTAERDRFRAASRRNYLRALSAERRIANLYANVPANADFLLATPHQIDPNMILTKDGRPDRRTREGREFRIFTGESSYVVYNGKRVCIMLTTVSEE